MQKLTRQELMSLESYAEKREAFRAQVIEHKRHRRIPLGQHLNLYFEDRLTMQYQVQEMLRVERIFEASGIEEELEAYNPLIPDGSNWKATMMLEYDDVEVRKKALGELVGIETRIWIRIADETPVYAIADEDLDRSDDDKTSSVHFLRFELGETGSRLALEGATVSMGVDHPAYRHEIELSADQASALAADLG